MLSVSVLFLTLFNSTVKDTKKSTEKGRNVTGDLGTKRKTRTYATVSYYSDICLFVCSLLVMLFQ